MEKIYILDAVHTLFRSYFAITKMTNKRGESTNALFGFIRTIQKLIKEFKPTHLIAVFDGPQNKQHRAALYEHYKSHRKSMPDDLFPQLDLAKRFCEIAGIPILTIPGHEADDAIGCVAKWAEKKGFEVYICSSDKDLCQLVNDRIFLLNTYKDNLIVDKAKVEETFGVRPDQIVDYLAIVGDSSDNIPGVAGLGPKAATALLQEYGDLKTIYAHAHEIKGKRGESLLQCRDEAFLSQELATLQLHLEVPTDENFYRLAPPHTEALIDLYRDMNFSSLIKELQTSSPDEPAVAPSKKVSAQALYHLIDDEAACAALVEKLLKEKEICLDTETDDLRPFEAEIVGLGLGASSEEFFYIPFNGKVDKKRLWAILKPLFTANIGFYGHNIKYDIHVLANDGIELKKIAFDTMLASYLLSPHENRHGLDALSLEHFEKVKISIKSLIGTGKNQISMREVPLEFVSTYCCEDVDYTMRLKELFEPELEKRSLTPLLEKIELPLIPVLISMERHGIFLDVAQLKAKSVELCEKISEIEAEIYQLSGEVFNINSPKQLSAILYEKLALERPAKKRGTAVGTGAEILTALKNHHPIAAKILEYRSLEKLRSTYVDSLPLQVSPKTGKIHCSFNQSVAATGRLSCTDPNLQNIPIRSAEGRKIREAFRPKLPGWSFLAADYSQIELRILAHLSEDPTLIKAFHENQDIHSFTAAQIYELPIDQITKEMRHKAKAVNFGLIYGQGAYGLSQELEISHSEASQFIKKYFERYPKVRYFLEECKENARKTGIVRTMTGRQRPVPDIHSSNAAIRAQAERFAVNTPFQGAQADIIKMAMIEVDSELKKRSLKSFMILQIHDELIFEAPDDELVELGNLVKEKMETIIDMKVPLIVDISIGKNWGEC